MTGWMDGCKFRNKCHNMKDSRERQSQQVLLAPTVDDQTSK